MSPGPILFHANPRGRHTGDEKAPTRDFSSTAAQTVRTFHAGIDGYAPTPLASLETLADYLGLAAVWVKDESHRFGLNAFKALGASYALGHELASAANTGLPKRGFGEFRTEELIPRMGRTTCITATDGNHGRAVAWAAREAGCRCVVYMPSGTAPVRLEHIRNLGATADIIDGNYDDAVKLAAQDAAGNGWLLVQDTAMPGYEDIPRRVMQGYLTMFEEALAEAGDSMPTHVFVQCGVGSLAAACQAYLVERFGSDRPQVVVVEADRAACFYQSMQAGDGCPHPVTGPLDTIMAGLACGEPSLTAWDILKDWADVFVACPDRVTRRGMRVLGNPLPGDPRVVSGESGAVTTGLLFEACRSGDEKPLKTALALNERSRVLLLSTEGDTDPEMYRRIVWGNALDA